MTLTATFDPVVSRVRLAATSVTGGATTALFERSANGLLWTTVRAGSAVTVTAGAAAVDDYEFIPNAVNYYRVTGAPGAVTFTDDVTPDQDDVWLKNIARPYLNRPVVVVDHTDPVRPSRNQTFPVIARTMPVALTDVHLSRVFELTVKTETPADADTLETVLCAGDILLVQVPATGRYATIPGGYVSLGDVTRSRYGKKSERRWLTLPCTEAAAPGPGVYGLPATWETILAEFGSWTAVLSVFATWQEVLDYVSSPSVVVVP